MAEKTNYRILVIDDDIMMHNILNGILNPLYEVYFAQSGMEALANIKGIKPDIILLDIMLPGMSGYEVLTELKQSNTMRNIPVILVTSLNNVIDEEKGFMLGASDYITKPFHESIVKARVQAQLNLISMLNNKSDTGFMLKTKREIRHIPFRKLIYVEINGHWLKFHIEEETLEIYASLKGYEEILLKETQFARCHKSFIVNMDFIDIIEVRDVLLTSGERLPISKSYLGFKKNYLSYISKKT